MDLEGKICKLAARAAATSPSLVRKAVGALKRRSPARAASDVLIYQFLSAVFIFFATGFLNLVAVRASGGNDCTVAYILFELSYHSGMIALLLLAPACVLFFLRAAGSSSSSSEVKDKDEVEDRSVIFLWPLIWPALGFVTVATLAAPIACSSNVWISRGFLPSLRCGCVVLGPTHRPLLHRCRSGALEDESSTPQLRQPAQDESQAQQLT